MAMRIRDVMTKNPVTVGSETLVIEARRLMKERNFRRLPVVDDGKLVGIVTQKDLEEAAPPPTSSSNLFELHYFLSKMKVKEVMEKNPATVSPDAPFEEALRLGQEKNISSFLVVEKGKLIGITTESDIVKLLTRALGLKQEGVRFTIEGFGGKLGDLQKIISILDHHGAPILSMMSLPRPEKKDWLVALRIKTKDPKPIFEELKKAGFTVDYFADPIPG
jgi:acetoin utilization protein AcuB